MAIYFWIAEFCLWNSGWLATRALFHWRGIQNVLWPVTLVVRAIARDPLRDEEPRRFDPARVDELERSLGVGPYALEGDVALKGPAAPKGPLARALAHSDERSMLSEQARSLHRQYSTQKIDEAHQRLVFEMHSDDLDAALGTLRWMQAYVCQKGSQGYEDTSGGQERYDELREALWAARQRGNHLMAHDARRVLSEWCARHNDPRQGRSFPMPEWHTYRPWRGEGDSGKWMDAFGGFQ